MCLEIIGNRKPKAKRATGDIVAYKVMIDLYPDSMVYRTPYTNCPWNPQISKELKVGLFVPISMYTYELNGKKYWNIGRGVIHTYRTLKSAQTYSKFFSDSVVWKVAIPKGTRYFESKWEYASRKIRFIEEV